MFPITAPSRRGRARIATRAHPHVGPAPLPKVESTPLATGVDVKADAGYIILPPSAHASGQRYTWDAGAHPDDGGPSNAPPWLLEKLRGKSTGKPSAGPAAGLLGRGLGPGKAAARCPWSDEHSSGADFDSSTVVFAPSPGHRMGWFHCAHEHCRDQTLADVLRTLPDEAVTKARETLGLDPDLVSVSRETKPKAPGKTRRDWKKELRFDEQGKLTKYPGNVHLIISHDPEWVGSICMDDFSGLIEWAKSPPMPEGFTAPEPGEPFAEHAVGIQHWFVTRRNVLFSARGRPIEECLCLRGRRHLIRELRKDPRYAKTGCLKFDADAVDEAVGATARRIECRRASEFRSRCSWCNRPKPGPPSGWLEV
jgi:hypothetical protein